MGARDAIDANLEALGDFIRTQRQRADLTLRELAAKASVSNPYLSQIERGLHEPSVRVLKAIAGALNISGETLLAQAGLLEARAGGGAAGETEADATARAIAADPRLTAEQKQELLSRYRALVGPEPVAG